MQAQFRAMAAAVGFARKGDVSFNVRRFDLHAGNYPAARIGRAASEGGGWARHQAGRRHHQEFKSRRIRTSSGVCPVS